MVCYSGMSQFKKVDTTVKIGKAGYRIVCNNKAPDKNFTTLKPVGFESGAREMEFYVKGRIERVEVEDFNNDGFPDMIMFSRGGPNPNDYVTVYTVLSAENKSFVPVFFPDLLDDAKLRDGYKGHDEFSLMEGMIMRTFPIYKSDDAPDKPTGGKRSVQYKLFSIEGGYRFKVIRSFELKQ
jgi:hypothetical protein